MVNRLAELDATLQKRRRPQPRRDARSAASRRALPLIGKPRPRTSAPAQAASSLRAKIARPGAFQLPSRSFAALDDAVPGTFAALAQPTPNSCWATVYTMLRSWRQQQSLRIDDALSAAGKRWLDIYKADTGLSREDKADFLAAAGLVAEPPQSWSVEGWDHLLRRYGPIWVTTDEAAGKPWAIHARVIIGMRGDGTPEGTHFTIVDPAGGRRYEESIAAFIPKYEEEVRRTGYTRIQVVHWQADATAEMKALALGGRVIAFRSRSLGSDTLAETVARLRGQGVPEAELREFLESVGVTSAFAMPRAMEAPRGVEVTLPGGYVLQGWKREAFLAALSAVAGPAGAVLIPGIRALANRLNVCIGVGPAASAGLVGGGGLGAGILFAPNDQIGFYGSAALNLGAIFSLNATIQVIIIHGGPANFGGRAMAVTVAGGEGIIGSASALFSQANGKFLGVTFEMGVGAGLSPIEFYVQFQGTGTTLSLARSSALELSGAAWVARFPGSTATSDLTQPFRAAVEEFVAALRTAGAGVSIGSTLRPPERAYLMHHAWRIAREAADPQAVPRMAGVDIDWVHRDAAGAVDLAASRQAAEQMVSAYQMVHRAALTSRHTEGRGIDMDVAWTGDLTIQRKDGTAASITTTPRDGMNAELHKVGASYGVVKLLSDPPHWSDDGH